MEYTLTKGFFYIRKNTKPGSWTLYYEYTENAKTVQQRVPDLGYSSLGVDPNLSLEEARKRIKRLNQERSLKKKDIKSKIAAAHNVATLNSYDKVLFPQEYVDEFATKVLNKGFGGDAHKKKIRVHFNFIQKMIKSLRLLPYQYSENQESIYRYFIKQKVSLSYARKLVSMLNAWGQFVSKKETKYFGPLNSPRANAAWEISDSQRTKKGKTSELGVRTESNPLPPDLLEKFKTKMNVETYNYLFITVWFGLRPYEVEQLSDTSTWSVIEEGGVQALKIYQSKLKNLERSKRFKFIPILYKEQEKALKIIKEGQYKRPTAKAVRKIFGSNITLYGGRKNFTDLMLKLGQKIKDVSLWLGHADISTTWKSYKQKNILTYTKVG